MDNSCYSVFSELYSEIDNHSGEIINIQDCPRQRLIPILTFPTKQQETPELAKKYI